MSSDYDEITEQLITALVLSLAHDLAQESRRKGVTGRDHVSDAVELIRQSRTHILELLRGDRPALRRAASLAGARPGRGGFSEDR
ncbi:MAG TPA: hypothetical protein VMD75_15825 [Candidatus Binataceae bacterium]|nr:hypothetical protein [Candidatus Binataceae bacterium]